MNETQVSSVFILHPSSFILHPSSFILAHHPTNEAPELPVARLDPLDVPSPPTLIDHRFRLTPGRRLAQRDEGRRVDASAGEEHDAVVPAMDKERLDLSHDHHFFFSLTCAYQIIIIR